MKGQLDTDNNTVSCSLLVNYLRAAIILTTANTLLVLVLTVNLAVPLLDFKLMSYRCCILERDFLMLNVSQLSVLI